MIVIECYNNRDEFHCTKLNNGKCRLCILESKIQQLENELAKERAVVDWYADAYYWDAGAYSDISTIDSGDIEKVGKRLIGGKRARARQAERSEG